MKHIQVLILLLLSVALVVSFCLIPSLKAESHHDNTLRIIPTYRSDGTVTFTVLTITNHGTYTPRNSGVIWVTTESGSFVKTLKIWAVARRNYLTKWNSFANNNTTGAVTGATLSNHQTHTATWDCKNTAGTQMPDGNYKVWVEFTESNGTGPFTSVVFTKGSNPVHLTPANTNYFHNMVLDFAPVVTVAPPTNLAFTMVTNTQVKLTWDAPASTYGLTAYKIFRDGVFFQPSIGLNTLLYDNPSEGTHSYYVTAVFGAHESEPSNTVNVNIVANDDETTTPGMTALIGNYPNPFTPQTNIRYSLAKAGAANLTVFNVKGQKVKTLVQSNQPAGQHSVLWNATDDSGKRVPAGYYFYRLQTDSKTLVKKMIILK
jgi:flagellar hook assembly protein FlgD